MTDPKPRRFTADEMEILAQDALILNHPDSICRRLYGMLRQAAATERERERIIEQVRGFVFCVYDRKDGPHHFNAHNYYADNCPACAIRRAAGLEES